MKKLILASLVLLMGFAAVPAIAGDMSSNNLEPAAFQALSNLSAPGQVALNTMTDEQLASVEGQRWKRHGRGGDKNVSKVVIIQSNNIGCAYTFKCSQDFNFQSNSASVSVSQSN